MIHRNDCWPVCNAINYDEVVSTSIREKIKGDFLKWSVWSRFLDEWFFDI